jgi:glycosyltransferase involved in cell wall biosynthesis
VRSEAVSLSLVADPTFSVVMPAYNVETTIGPAVESVLRQTWDDFELIVVDDGSTDQTHAAVEPFEVNPRVRVVRHENRGLAAARNTGIAHARGEHLAFLDSDDLWMPTYLEAMARALAEDPRAGIGYTDAWVLDERTRAIYRRGTAMSCMDPPAQPPQDPQALFARLVRGNFIFSSATVRRSVIEKVGPFDSRLRAAEDWELWLRIAAHGYRAVRPPGMLAIYRSRPGSLSKDEVLLLSSVRRVLQFVAEEYEDIPDDLRAVARAEMLKLDASLSSFGRKRAAVRGYGIRLRDHLLSRRLWYRQPPAEVTAAFPDLHAV